MELLTDQDIQELCTVSQFDDFETHKPMIYPFVDTQIEHGKISYGLSSFGYDMRVSNEFKVFTNVWNTVVDPKQLDERSFVDQKIENKDGNYCLIPPNSFALARSLEHFNIPDTVMAIVTGKSTYARAGIITNTTPLEPGWQGYVTLEISNTTPLPARIYINEGICQVLFFRSDKRPLRTYSDKKGKYQDQVGIVLPTIKKRGSDEL